MKTKIEKFQDAVFALEQDMKYLFRSTMDLEDTGFDLADGEICQGCLDARIAYIERGLADASLALAKCTALSPGLGADLHKSHDDVEKAN